MPLLGCAVPGTFSAIEASAVPGAASGRLRFGRLSFPCALGRSGIRSPKAEGDGATPAGLFPLREVRYRPDRLPAAPQTALPVIASRPLDGWCDDPADANYNRPVQLPYPHSAERMWRDDQLYDVLAVIGYNDAPPVPGAGSAIFLHVMRPDRGPTSGCIALARDHLLAVLAHCAPGTAIRIDAV
jgi:L,D-peptidoglycan transpeptidase YkuD (ErfK/YbiS/YcfS/YnhG family)